MRVSKISIRNILGIEALEITPGNLTRIEGKNGTGKTSVLEAIRSLVGGGHDAQLLRKGTKKGEVVLVIDHPEHGPLVARKSITATGSTVSVSSEKLGEIGKPQTFLAGIIDALSANPVDFLLAPPKRRAAWLLEALPMTVTPAQIEEHCGITAMTEECEGHALRAIGRVFQRLYDQRTGVNRAAKEKAITAGQLEQGLAPEALDAPKLATRKREILTEQVRIDEALGAERDRLAQELAAEEERIRNEAERRLAELQLQMDEIKASRSECIRIAQSSLALQRAILESRANEEVAPLVAEAATVEERLRYAERDAANRALAQRMRTEARQREEESDRLSTALAALDEYKLSLLQDLPIPGLAVEGEEITYQGIPFDRVNHAERVRIAVKVARLRARELGLVIFDGFEALDPETFAAFERFAAQQEDVQFVVSRVTGAETLEIR
jgi:hypothetical protein